MTLILLFTSYCIGSFITMVAYRYPKMLLVRNKHSTRLSFFSPSSHCPCCQHPLAWRDNIPVLSYLWLCGRCRYCQAAISICYWCTEVVTLLLSGWIIYAFQQLTWLALLGRLSFTWILVTLSCIDWRSGLLPDTLTLGLLWLGLLFHIVTGQGGLLDEAVLGAVLGYLLFWSVFQVHYRFTQRVGMGYGDFKLAAAIGAWVGWDPLLTVLWYATLFSLIGFLLYYFWSCIKRAPILPVQRLRLPFGPYLALAGWLVFMRIL